MDIFIDSSCIVITIMFPFITPTNQRKCCRQEKHRPTICIIHSTVPGSFTGAHIILHLLHRMTSYICMVQETANVFT
jgi:hypothetical protein